MTRDEFPTYALREGILPSSYSLQGGLVEDQYVLDHTADGGWSVYFVERRRRLDEMTFETEEDACAELFSRLVKDPSTRRF